MVTQWQQLFYEDRFVSLAWRRPVSMLHVSCLILTQQAHTHQKVNVHFVTPIYSHQTCCYQEYSPVGTSLFDRRCQG